MWRSAGKEKAVEQMALTEKTMKDLQVGVEEGRRVGGLLIFLLQ